ncbi:MAG: hypothetical protein V6Z89_02320 [Desulfobacter sp.]
MNTNMYQKPKFYFSSQKAARQTIFWLFVACAGLLIMAHTSLRSYETKGYITVPQRSGSIEIHGPDAMTTIYFYRGSSLFFFCLGSYFSIIYIRVRSANKRSPDKIVPETYTFKQVICPSCYKKASIDPSSYLICSDCSIKMEGLKEFYQKQSQSPEAKTAQKSDPLSEKIYRFLYPDFDELSIFLMGFVLLLLIFFNAECRSDLIELIKPNSSIGSTSSLLSICFSIGVTIILLFGMAASFIHVLIVSKKSGFSVRCMKAFALITLIFIGLKSGYYVLENHNYMWIVSPGWNFLMALACYSGLGMIDEIPFDQTDVKFLQTILSVILVSIIFYALNYVFELYWPITFSLCVNYVVCINRGAVNSKFLKLYNIHR